MTTEKQNNNTDPNSEENVLVSRTSVINTLGDLITDNHISNALNIAEEAHKYQRRDNGNSYLEEHIYPMVIGLINRYSDEDILLDLIPVALLHDVLEDSNYTEEEMKNKVGLDITNEVKLLTKSPEENAHGASQDIKREMNKRYLKRVTKGNNIVKIIKIEDRLQNISCITKKCFGINPEKYTRYIYETREEFIPIAEELKDSKIDYPLLLEEQCKRVEEILNTVITI